MKKVAVFGAPAAGKSILSKKLAAATQLPLYPLDKLCFEAGGAAVPPEVYARRHAEILAREAWLIEAMAATNRCGRGLLQPIRWSTSTCPSCCMRGG